jgi:hypothetical protein
MFGRLSSELDIPSENKNRTIILNPSLVRGFLFIFVFMYMKLIISESQYKKLISENNGKEIIEKKKHIENIIPKIEKYFKIKFKGDLDKIDINMVSVKYGEEDLILEIPRMEFYFNNPLIGRVHEITGDLRDVFNIEMFEYGVPLRIRIYEKTWKLVY